MIFKLIKNKLILCFDNLLFLLLGSIKELIWKANLQMKWPEEFNIEGIARRKTDAINICYLLACHKLKVCYSFHFTYLEKYFSISPFIRTFSKCGF